MNINKNWVFYRLNEPEKRINVDLPYDAMLREPRDISHLGGDKVSFFKGDDYGYEKIINIEKKNQVFYLEFEGVYHHPIIFVNDKQVYEREYEASRLGEYRREGRACGAHPENGNVALFIDLA